MPHILVLYFELLPHSLKGGIFLRVALFNLPLQYSKPHCTPDNIIPGDGLRAPSEGLRGPGSEAEDRERFGVLDIKSFVKNLFGALLGRSFPFKLSRGPRYEDEALRRGEVNEESIQSVSCVRIAESMKSFDSSIIPGTDNIQMT